MKIKSRASAGTYDKSDIMIRLAPADVGIELSVKSIVYQQFGKAIRQTILTALDEMDIENTAVEVEDFGAPDFVIRARLEAAIMRSMKVEDA